MSDLKRYMLISIDHYYPKGGIEDCEGSFDTLDEALAACYQPPPGVYADYTEYIFDRIDGIKIPFRYVVSGKIIEQDA